MKWTPVLMALGYGLLGTGLVLYIRVALAGAGAIWPSFVCLMSSLLFFNLPAVLARRRDQKKARDGRETP